MSSQVRPAISIILAAHHEGRIAHHTLRSVARALQMLDAHDISHELIITLDSPDPATVAYFEAQSVVPARILQAAFGDLAQTRNYSVQKARGTYIATLDSDDLISGNWLYAAYSMLQERSDRTVAHTQYSVNFGTKEIVWEKFDSRSKTEDALIMTQANRWDSAIAAHRDVFEEFPYQSNSRGFGSEDWHFNSQTLAADIPHVVVSETVLFVRRKDVSEMTIQAGSWRTVHYSDLLDTDFVKSIDIRPYQTGPSAARTGQARQLLRRSAVSAYRQARRLSMLDSALQRARNRYVASRADPATGRFPEWLIAEWRAMHVIEKQLFPSRTLLHTIELYHSEMYELGVLYHRLVSHLTRNPDYIIFAPYIVRGGADLVILNYVHALRRIHPDWQIAVVTTEDHDSPWADRLPQGIDLVPFGRLAGNLTEQLKLQILARFVVQTKARRLHIIQSGLAFTFAEHYRTLLSDNGYTVYANAFCDEIDPEGRHVGHIYSGLPNAYDTLSRIFTDNDSVAHQLVAEYAADPGRFVTHYQPANQPIRDWHPPKTTDGVFRLLWAGRIAQQKRPDILRAIGRQLDPGRYHIDVYGTLQDGYTADYFADTPAITYHGAYNGPESLPLQDYHALLYTSDSDGLPNVLLEMASFGLPIVASDIGGIGELIRTGETGMLVAPYDKVAAYVRALEALQQDPAMGRKLSRAMADLLRERHSPDAFDARLRTDIS